MLHKTLETKATTQTDLGVFSAIAAAYTTDRVGERILKGAFQKTIGSWQASGKLIPLHYDHKGDPEFIIGSVDPMAMKEVEDGLYVEGRVDLEGSEIGREAWRSIKGNTMSLSFGYLAKEKSGADGVTELTEIDLFEVTVTPAPAQADTRFLSVKSAPATEISSNSEVEDGSDEEPSEVKSAPQDPLKKRSMELALEIAREGVPRQEPEVKEPEPEVSTSDLRRRSFEAILETVRD